MLNAENHLADNIRDCYLTPIGSFAFGCMRNDCLVVDALLTYNKVQDISEEELLKLYQSSLETCYELDKEAGTNTTNMELRFETHLEGNFLEITETKKSNGTFKMRVYISNTTDKAFQIAHVRDVYKSLDQSVEQLNSFRNLLKMFNIWKSNLQGGIPSEIIEIVQLAIFLSKTSPASMEENVTKTLTILSSESLTNSILSKFDQRYQHVYENVSKQSKEALMKAAQESGARIAQRNFVEGQIF